MATGAVYFQEIKAAGRPFQGDDMPGSCGFNGLYNLPRGRVELEHTRARLGPSQLDLMLGGLWVEPQTAWLGFRPAQAL
jgi:hypothetical protein